ncbi:MAG: glycerophosphodiester phosphodiesterase [Acidimicrobiia bacterium]|nr:glycerophosphodiester phosphodiesterase [Acidimicrobiia bacterium]
MLVLAHRGACREAPENTLEAFRIARAVGADGVELDVRRTAEGALVVHHDAEAVGLGALHERSLDELRAARPEIPTLEEALDELAGLLVNVEIKNLPGDADFDEHDGVARAVVELLHGRDGRDRVLVSSFNLGTVDRVHALGPEVATGWLTLLGLDPLDAVPVAAGRGHRALHPDDRSLPGPVLGAVVERAHGLGLSVHVWTVDDPERVRELSAAGIDAVITNEPAGALRVLGR